MEKAESFANDEEVSEAVRIGTKLSIATYTYEVLEKEQEAIQIAEKALEEVEPRIPEIQKDEDAWRDCNSIISLLKENLELWKGQGEHVE